MANLIYRETTVPDVPTATSSKGAPLTNLEIDGNFKSINNELGDIDNVLISALLDSDIGTTVQAYDATILTEADLGTSVQAYDATILTEADLGSTVAPPIGITETSLNQNLYITLLNSNTGDHTESLVNNDLRYNPSTGILLVNGSPVVTSSTASATPFDIVATTAPADYFFSLHSASSGTYTTSNVDVDLKYNPETNVLTINNGTVNANDFNSTSDERKKDNIRIIDDAVNKVMNLNGVYFDWKEKPGQSSTGVIAQNVETVFPELVKTNDEGYKSVNYDGLIGVLIEAVKELKEEVEKLKAL